MGEDLARFGSHPSGEQFPVESGAAGMAVVVDSFAGSVRVEFDHEAAFTPLGQAASNPRLLLAIGVSVALGEMTGSRSGPATDAKPQLPD